MPIPILLKHIVPAHVAKGHAVKSHAVPVHVAKGHAVKSHAVPAHAVHAAPLH